jgi:uroporphyrinogen-III synthase
LLNSVNGSYDLPKEIKIAVIGDSTANELKNYNHKVDYRNEGITSDEFLEFLMQNVLTRNTKVLLALGNLALDKLQKSIEKICAVSRMNVYQTIKPTKMNKEILEIANKQLADMLVFTSPSAFRNFIEISAFDSEKLTSTIACIGKTTAAYIESQGMPVNIVASKPKTEVFASEIIRYLNK